MLSTQGLSIERAERALSYLIALLDAHESIVHSCGGGRCIHFRAGTDYNAKRQPTRQVIRRFDRNRRFRTRAHECCKYGGTLTMPLTRTQRCYCHDRRRAREAKVRLALSHGFQRIRCRLLRA